MIPNYLINLINFVIVVCAFLCAIFAFAIYRLSCYRGMLWLGVAMAYATILRGFIFFDPNRIGQWAVYGMLPFWGGLLYAKWGLYLQIKHIMKGK